jgi:hypothetical protein
MLLPTLTHQEPAAPPHWMPTFVTLGLVIAALFAIVGWRAARGHASVRFTAGTLFAIWSFGAGFLGILLTLLWTITDHTFAHRNENLLVFNPLWLVLAVLAPMTAVKGRLSRVTRWLTFTLVALATIAFLLHVTGMSRESNGEVLAFALPPMLALAWAVHRGTARRLPAET